MAPDATLWAPDGGTVTLSELWADGPVVIAFMRHFGCAFCKDHLAQLRQERTRIVEAGADVVAILQGPPNAAGDFCRQRDVPFRCFADPDRSAYKSFSLELAGPGRWANPRTLARGVKLFRKGIASGLPHPGQDIRQMPGTFVIAKGGRVRLAHYNFDASDNPSVESILGALGAS